MEFRHFPSHNYIPPSSWIYAMRENITISLIIHSVNIGIMSVVNSVNNIRLPPSSRRVLLLLDDGKARTFKEVTEEVDIAPRTIRYAIKRLKESGLIIEKFNFKDARQVLYQTKKAIQSEETQTAMVA